MLYAATLGVDLLAMAITLWMAFYLFARGYPNPITLRAVVILLALSFFFHSAYTNLFHQVSGTAALRAVMLIAGLSSWYGLTYRLAAGREQPRQNWLGIGIYVLGAGIAALMLSDTSIFIGEQGNVLYVARMGVGLPFVLYGIFQIMVCAGILYNLLSGDRIGLTSQGRFFLVASILPTIGVGYGILALAIVPPLPRLIQDLIVFGGVFLLGISVLRHQLMVERRTTFQDFPLTTLVVLSLAAVYAFIALRLGLPPETLATVVTFAVLTHAVYDLVREFLERLRFRRESDFRKRLRQFDGDGAAEHALRTHLQEGLDRLCRNLNATGGLIAVRRDADFLVTATHRSAPLDTRLGAALVACDDLARSQSDTIPGLAWLAPSFEGQTQIAVVGIGKPKAKPDFSGGDLDLLAEFADQVGTVVSLDNLRPQRDEQIRRLVAESRIGEEELSSLAGGMLGSIGTNPAPEFVKIVEEGLRNLPDFIILGQSPLADRLDIRGETHVERGRRLQQLLVESIDSLRPADQRPPEPLPRVWYNHAVLHDAYVEGVPNREIMARLYISEGTFNRTRRNALRGLARLIEEKNKMAVSGSY
jgi:hypothetical protein